MGAKRASVSPKASPKAKAAKVEDPIAVATKKVKASLAGVFASLDKEAMKKVKDALKELTPPTKVPDIAADASQALAGCLEGLTTAVTDAKAQAETVLGEAAALDAEVADATTKLDAAAAAMVAATEAEAAAQAAKKNKKAELTAAKKEKDGAGKKIPDLEAQVTELEAQLVVVKGPAPKPKDVKEVKATLLKCGAAETGALIAGVGAALGKSGEFEMLFVNEAAKLIEEKVAGIKTDISQKSAGIPALAAKVEEIEAAISSMDAELQSKASDVKATQTEQDAATAAKKEAEKKQKAKAGAVKKATSSIEEAEAAVTAATEGVEAFDFLVAEADKAAAAAAAPAEEPAAAEPEEVPEAPEAVVDVETQPVA
jgi:chromosome segregation ATPase